MNQLHYFQENLENTISIFTSIFLQFLAVPVRKQRLSLKIFLSCVVESLSYISQFLLIFLLWFPLVQLQISQQVENICLHLYLFYTILSFTVNLYNLEAVQFVFIMYFYLFVFWQKSNTMTCQRDQCFFLFGPM